jgi:outer membrane protein insertion porin family
VAFRSSDPDQPLVFSAAELRPLLSLQEGDVFNVTKIRESLDAIARRYGEYGYINFITTPVTEVNDSTQRVSIIFELDQGRRFRISKVEVHGLDPGKEAVLASRLHPGDIFRNSLVEDAAKAMAPDLSDDELKKALNLRKDEKNGTVAIIVDLSQRPSPESESETELDEP